MYLNNFLVGIFYIILVNIISPSISSCQTLQTVPNVDLKKYAGKWYEIASYPQWFQRGCHCTVAEYKQSNNGYIMVRNQCNKGNLNGKVSSIDGKAFVVANSGNAKLKVQFFWPFKGDYWIIDLANDYTYAVVSDPEKESLWILSRSSKMPQKVYEEIIDRLRKMGFNLEKLQKTPQKG